MKPDRLEELLQRYIDRRLTPPERVELEQELLSSPAARRVFWQQLHLEGIL